MYMLKPQFNRQRSCSSRKKSSLRSNCVGRIYKGRSSLQINLFELSPWDSQRIIGVSVYPKLETFWETLSYQSWYNSRAIGAIHRGRLRKLTLVFGTAIMEKLYIFNRKWLKGRSGGNMSNWGTFRNHMEFKKAQPIPILWEYSNRYFALLMVWGCQNQEFFP